MSDEELKYAHLGWRDTPRRAAARRELQADVDEIWAEQEKEAPPVRIRPAHPASR